MITADAQQLEPGGRITVYELDASSFGADKLFFHATCRVASSGGRARNMAPGRSRPAASSAPATSRRTAPCALSNIDGRITAMVLLFDDLVGARIIRRQTLAKYLDAAQLRGRQSQRGSWRALP